MVLNPAEVDALERVLAIAERAEAAKERAELVAARPALLKQVSEAELIVQRKQTLYDAYDSAVRAASREVQEVFCRRASQYVLEGERVILDVTGKEVVFGLEVAGELRPGLSGSEGVRLLVATIGAFPPEQEGRALVVTMPDNGWDAEHTTEFMEAVKALPHQVLFGSTTKYKGRKPAGWDLLELNADRSVKKPVGGKAKKAKAKIQESGPPGAPEGAPTWLTSVLGNHKPVQVENLEAFINERSGEGLHFTAAEITRAPSFKDKDAIWHFFRDRKLVSYTPFNSKAAKYVWTWR